MAGSANAKKKTLVPTSTPCITHAVVRSAMCVHDQTTYCVMIWRKSGRFDSRALRMYALIGSLW